MGKLVYFCAGTNANVLPAKTIDALLLNVVQNGATEKDVEESRNLMAISQAKTVMLDSGGFQLLQAKEKGLEIIFDPKAPILRSERINLTPWHVVRAAARIHPQIMVGLDFPIAKIQEKEKQDIEFRFKLGFNVDWAITTAELRQKQCPDIQLFIPIQCYTTDHLDLFLKLIGDIPFNGVSMPVRNLSTTEIALFMVRFYQLGIRQVHLLGVSSFFVIALAAYMARHLFEWVSLDATTWRIQAQFGQYMNPHDLLSESLEENVLIDERFAMDCKCPWCKGKTFTYIKHLPFTEKTAFLRSHNHWVIEKAAREIYNNSTSLATLRSHLRKRSRKPEEVEKLCRTLTLIEEFKDAGFDSLQSLLI